MLERHNRIPWNWDPMTGHKGGTKRQDAKVRPKGGMPARETLHAENTKGSTVHGLNVDK